MTRKLLLSLSLLWVGSAFALSVPDHPIGRVHDEADLINASEASHLEAKLKAFEDETSNQIVVATFPSLEGESLEDFSIRLAEQWQIGQKDKNNGIILLIFPNDRKLRIEVGYGLEGAVPDAYASRIIEEKLKPAFRAGDFERGIDEAVDALIAATRGEYEAEPVEYRSSGPWFFYLIPALFFGMIPLLIFLKLRHPELFLGGSTYSHSGSSSGWVRSSSSGWSSGGGGGGFSGGGGSFGGGGSSGSW